MPKPSLSILERDDIERIHEASLYLLEEVGVFFESRRAIEIFKDEGISPEGYVVKIPRDLVESCLRSVPQEFQLYDRDGRPYTVIGRGMVHFNPGSAATKVLDYSSLCTRPATIKDMWDFSLLADSLHAISLQSTAIVPSEVPEELKDRVRLIPIILQSKKPIVTGAFTLDGIERMKFILEATCGDLSKKPYAIFDVCPSPPLRWSRLTCTNLMDCASYGIPVEIIPMPQLGATAPVTIAGALVQHHAEALSGIVLSQLVRRGTPVIYGGSPCTLDMRYGTSAVASSEAILLVMAYTEIAKHYGLPTHAYVALADSLLIDYQAGVESAIGALAASMIGVDVASGPGMLEYESAQSLEKLVLDDELCSLAMRIAKGFDIDDEHLALDVINALAREGGFLTHRHTLKHFREEIFLPRVMERPSRAIWSRKGSMTLLSRAHEVVSRVLLKHKPTPPPPDVIHEIKKRVRMVLGEVWCEQVLKFMKN